MLLRSARPRRAALALALALAAGGALASCGKGADATAAGPLASTPSPVTAVRRTGPSPSPTSSPTARPTPRAVAPVTIAFAGDVHFEAAAGARLAADPSTAIGPMAPTLAGADLAMVNLETAITTRGNPQPKAFTFRAPATALTAVRDAGIDVVTMANNHGVDYGPQGLADSLAAIRGSRFPVVGIGADEDAAYAARRFTVRGQRIAILGASQVIDDNLVAAWSAGPGHAGIASAKREDRLVEAVRQARRGADTVVVYLHWGMERNPCPIAAQTELVPRLAAAGADVIVGSHAHVRLGGGWTKAGGRRTVFVDYGLGNFVFYSDGSAPTSPTKTTGVLLLTVKGRATTAARWVPARIVDAAPRPLTGADAAASISDWDGLRGCAGLASSPPR